MLCRICNQQRKLSKSHVIPEAFFREIRDENEVPHIFSNAPGSFPKKAPIGVYDKTILCEQCEAKFNDMDDYGIKVLLKEFSTLFNPVLHDGEEVAVQSNRIDQHRLLVFLIGTLWKASVSNNEFYRRVQLGPFENLAKYVVQNPNNQISPVFGAVLSVWHTTEETESLAKGLMDPFREKWFGVNAYRLYFGKVTAYIRVDQRPFPAVLERFALGRQDTTTLITRKFCESKDLQALRGTAIQSHQNHLAAKKHPSS